MLQCRFPLTPAAEVRVSHPEPHLHLCPELRGLVAPNELRGLLANAQSGGRVVAGEMGFSSLDEVSNGLFGSFQDLVLELV